MNILRIQSEISKRKYLLLICKVIYPQRQISENLVKSNIMKSLKFFDAQHYLKIVINQLMQYLNNKYKVKYDFITKFIFTI